MAEAFRATDLTVVIPTRERWPILARTLAGLWSQSAPGFEVVVVVDGSDQHPPELPGARTLVVEHGGPGLARNHGAAHSDRPLVLFLGDDMIPDADLVARHLDAHNEHPEQTDAVLGRVDWHPEVASGRFQHWLDWSGTQFDFASIDGTEAGFGRFYSCNISLKRQFFLDAGGFSDAFPYYYEDLDCGYRLSEKGMRLIFAPRARTLHLHRYAWADLERRFRGVASGEHTMAALHPWFTPFFLERIQGAQRASRRSEVWSRLVDSVPSQLPGVHNKIERAASQWYLQRLAPSFLSGWWAAEDHAELRAYLGERYDHSRLVLYQAAVDEERDAAPDEETFYRTSTTYLYDLTAFSMSATKAPYLAELVRHLAPGASILDYGCGIGADGLRLAAAGYDVSFADFANPSTQYLRWRLEQRGLDATIYDLDRDTIDGHFDAAFSFDVIEHVEDPFAFLRALEEKADVIAVNFLEEEPDDTDLHHPLPIPELLDYTAQRGLLCYRRYHQRSHLVIYRPSASGAAARAKATFERRLGERLPGRPGWFPAPRVR